MEKKIDIDDEKCYYYKSEVDPKPDKIYIVQPLNSSIEERKAQALVKKLLEAKAKFVYITSKISDVKGMKKITKKF